MMNDALPGKVWSTTLLAMPEAEPVSPPPGLTAIVNGVASKPPWIFTVPSAEVRLLSPPPGLEGVLPLTGDVTAGQNEAWWVRRKRRCKERKKLARIERERLEPQEVARRDEDQRVSEDAVLRKVCIHYVNLYLHLGAKFNANLESLTRDIRPARWRNAISEHPQVMQELTDWIATLPAQHCERVSGNDTHQAIKDMGLKYNLYAAERGLEQLDFSASNALFDFCDSDRLGALMRRKLETGIIIELYALNDIARVISLIEEVRKPKAQTPQRRKLCNRKIAKPDEGERQCSSEGDQSDSDWVLV